MYSLLLERNLPEPWPRPPFFGGSFPIFQSTPTKPLYPTPASFYLAPDDLRLPDVVGGLGRRALLHERLSWRHRGACSAGHPRRDLSIGKRRNRRRRRQHRFRRGEGRKLADARAGEGPAPRAR